MTLEEFNKNMEGFIHCYNNLFRRTLPDTFEKFKVYSSKEEDSFNVVIFALLKDGTENRVYKCSTTRSVKKSLSGCNTVDDTIERMNAYIKESFIETLMFSKDVSRLINEGDNFFLSV